jgi:hypothetical protein
LPPNLAGRWFESEDEIREKIRNDHSLGMDSLYRVNIKFKDDKFRIVAPFIEHALKPRKEEKKSSFSVTPSNKLGA